MRKKKRTRVTKKDGQRGQTDGHTEILTDRQLEGLTELVILHGQKDRQTDRQVDRQKD